MGADTETSTSFKVGDFEDMLNNVHSTIIDGHSWCPMDRWFDNHYAIDSRSVDNSKILSYINSKKPFHTCGSNPMRGLVCLPSLIQLALESKWTRAPVCQMIATPLGFCTMGRTMAMVTQHALSTRQS